MTFHCPIIVGCCCTIGSNNYSVRRLGQGLLANTCLKVTSNIQMCQNYSLVNDTNWIQCLLFKAWECDFLVPKCGGMGMFGACNMGIGKGLFANE